RLSGAAHGREHAAGRDRGERRAEALVVPDRAGLGDPGRVPVGVPGHAIAIRVERTGKELPRSPALLVQRVGAPEHELSRTDHRTDVRDQTAHAWESPLGKWTRSRMPGLIVPCRGPTRHLARRDVRRRTGRVLARRRKW